MLLHRQMHVIAKNTRKAPVKIVALAKSLGVRVYTATFLEHDISGLIKKDEDRGGKSGYAIFVNAHYSEVRRRFIIAHELAHFVLHRSSIGDGIVEDVLMRAKGFTNTLERQANAFAADILMPKELIAKAQKKGIKKILDLAEEFNVSKDVMSHRVYGVPYEEVELKSKKKK